MTSLLSTPLATPRKPNSMSVAGTPLALPLPTPSPSQPQGSECLKDQVLQDRVNQMPAPAKQPVKSRRNLNLDMDLTPMQKNRYGHEIFKFQQLCQSSTMPKDVDYSNLDMLINELTFDNLLKNVQNQCPLLCELFEVFTQTEEERKIKTAAEKLLRVIHMNACLLRIGSQTSSPFPLYLGILLISYGCGQGKFIEYRSLLNIET